MLRILLSCCLVLCLASSAQALYGKDSSVVGLTSLNFKNMILKNREDHVAIVEFFAPWCGHCRQFAPEYEKTAKNLRDIVRVAAVNCDEQKELCAKYDVKGYPTIKIFPSGPVKTPIDYQGPRDSKSLSNKAVSFLTDRVKKVTSENKAEFFAKDENLAHALLFTDKDKTPLIWRSLSNELKGKVVLGEVKNKEASLVQEFKRHVTKFPTILAFTPGSNKPHKFKGDVNFRRIFEFLNSYVETFSAAAPQHDEDGKDTKFWKFEAVPELFSKSSEDVCTGSHIKGLCVIAVLKGESQGEGKKKLVDETYTKMLVDVSALFERHIERGTKFNFMWMDVTQKDMLDAFGLSPDSAPTVVVLNPGKRKRFTKLSEEFNRENLEAFLNGILGGDARFKMLPKGLPQFNE